VTPAELAAERFEQGLGFTVGEGFKPPPRETDLEQDIRDWLAARARRRAEEAEQLAQQRQQQLAQQQLAQDAARRQALAQALAQRYPLGGGPPPPLVSPVCVRRPCQVAGWRFEQAVDEAVRGAWSKPDEAGEPAPRGPGRGIAQVRPPWRPPTRPPVRVVPLPGPRPERPDRRSVGERVAETPPAAFRPQPPSYHQPTIDVQGAPPRPPTMQGPGSWPEGPPPWVRTQEAEHARPPQAEPPPPPRPQQQAEHAPPPPQVQVRWNPKRSEHVFRDEEEGHLPRNEPNKEKWIATFIRVASNPANHRPDAVEAEITTAYGATQAGIRAYTQTLPTGEQVWVTVRNGEIQNAGVNPPGKHR
jgi:hypothetical protein